jgi:signal transduction histidine kinase/ligand-binding sensor domain-containing protein
VYRAADGLAESLCTAITASPRGMVWITHGEVGALSGLDGYTVQRVPTPPERIARVHQSRAGRLWALYPEGVLGLTGDEWTRYPLTGHLTPAEMNLLRAGRPPAIVPAEEDRLLIALPERLVLFRAVEDSLTVLREARQTPLGRFQEIIPAASGGLWVAGERGLGRVLGPLRRLGPEAEWRFHLPLPELALGALSRPVEDDDGGVTCVVELAGGERRGLAHFNGTQWQVHTVPGENIRFAWRGPAPDAFWVVTLNRLLWFAGTNFTEVRPPFPLAQIRDVAVQRRGVFWLATREGAVRHAPAAWRRAATGAETPEPFHSLAEDSAGRLWGAADSGLWRRGEAEWSRVDWPPGFEPAWQTGDSLWPLGEAGLLVTAGERAWRFDPSTRRFERVVHPEGRIVARVLSRLDDQTVGVLTRPPPERSEQNPRFERFDGRNFSPWPEAPPADGAEGEIFFLARARNGDWWLGTSVGPAWWREGRWQFFGPADGYTGDGALAWLEFEDGRIWCASLNRVLEFDGRRWMVVLPALDHVNSLLRVSDGSVWVAANNGLFRFYRGTWLDVGVPEGLPASAVTCVHEDRQRRLWAGTAAGPAEYLPRADFDPPRTLSLEWQQEASATGEGSGVITIRARDRWQFTPDDRLVFAHRLDEGEWSAWSPEPVVRLRGLAQGRHRVEVRAMDRNWNVELNPPGFDFRVLVPWYRDRRVVLAGLLGLVLTLAAAGVAVNRHLRLRRSYADVERLVEERTRELRRATDALAQSQKMTALGTLAAGIAHDFNNLLSIIKGSAQIIAAHPDDREKVLTRVSRILTMVDQAGDVVKALLGFGTATDRTVQPCDLNEIVTRTVRLLSDRFRRDVEVRLALAPDLPRVLAAPDLVQQILLNLIFNGADAMDGRGVIEVATARLAELPRDLALAPRPAVGYVRVSVRDTGCGIGPDVLPRIFEPFFTTKAQSGRPGRGLGLYMVYQFAREMGHGLHVETAPGQGSIFSLILPEAEA